MEIPETNGDELISKRAYPHYAPESNELTLFYADEARDYGQRGFTGTIKNLLTLQILPIGDRYVPYGLLCTMINVPMRKTDRQHLPRMLF